MSEDQPVISPMMRDGSPADPEKFGVVAIDFQTTEQAIVALEELRGKFDSANNGKFRVPMQDGALASVSFWWSDFRNKLEAMISDDCHGLRVFQLRRIDADSPLELTRQEVCDGMAEGLTKLVEGYALKEKLADSAPK